MTLFVTFEGTEGSGKTTQIRLLAEALSNSGRDVVVTREPGGTALGEVVRQLLLETDIQISPQSEAYLMTGVRAEHVQAVISPALARGSVVLCDRFYDSTLAYQGAGRGLPIEQLRNIQELAVNGCQPDITFLLDVPVTVGLERRRAEQGNNRLDLEGYAFHERVALWYRQEAQAHQDRWVIVDATQSPIEIHIAILNVVMQRLRADDVVREESGRA